MHEEFHKMPVAIKEVEEKMTERTFEEQKKITQETLSQCDYGTLMNCYEKTDELIGTIQRDPEGSRGCSTQSLNRMKPVNSMTEGQSFLEWRTGSF